VPETLHIGTYPHIIMWEVRDLLNHKSPAKEGDSGQDLFGALLIAMQKVEGSNPFSRFS
jgi:hypothetical protein